MNVIIVMVLLLLQTITGVNMGGLALFHSTLHSPLNVFTAVHSASVPEERYIICYFCHIMYIQLALLCKGFHTLHTHTSHTAQEDPGPGNYELRPQRTKSAPSRYPFNSSAKTQTPFSTSTVSSNTGLHTVNFHIGGK